MRASSRAGRRLVPRADDLALDSFIPVSGDATCGGAVIGSSLVDRSSAICVSETPPAIAEPDAGLDAGDRRARALARLPRHAPSSARRHGPWRKEPRGHARSREHPRRVSSTARTPSTTRSPVSSISRSTRTRITAFSTTRPVTAPVTGRAPSSARRTSAAGRSGRAPPINRRITRGWNAHGAAVCERQPCSRHTSSRCARPHSRRRARSRGPFAKTRCCTSPTS